MKVRQARSGDRAHSCRHCHRVIQQGQWFVYTEMPNNPITDRSFRVHVRCMERLVSAAPPDDDQIESSFNELRTKILTTNTAFPE